MILAHMGAYPGYKFHMFVWKLQQWSLEIRYMGAYPGVGACPGHYGICYNWPLQFQPLQWLHSEAQSSHTLPASTTWLCSWGRWTSERSRTGPAECWRRQRQAAPSSLSRLRAHPSVKILRTCIDEWHYVFNSTAREYRWSISVWRTSEIRTPL